MADDLDPERGRGRAIAALEEAIVGAERQVADLASVIVMRVAADRDCERLRGFLTTAQKRLAELRSERRRWLVKQ